MEVNFITLPWISRLLTPESQIREQDHRSEYVENSRGMKLFTSLIFLCHGYAMECSISMRGTAIPLTRAGFAVYGIDYEGHGKSSGLQGYVESFDAVVDDCSEHFTGICERPENRTKKRFLLGESMGGAVALLLHRKQPTFWNGAILVAPMCKISEEMKPHPIVISILTRLCKVIPTWKIIPTKDIIDTAIKCPERRMEVRNNPYCYKGRPRLRTGHELVKVSLQMEEKLHEVSLPFIIVHGGEDSVTDPAVSGLLYETAASADKTFKLYPEMWHALTSGEPPENIAVVFSDIVTWLDERSGGDARASSELEQKAGTTADTCR
ncbi:unnamed protein product [Spirodela intermedia]|uniref:Serine aminopeptidase S33 domain-containing protein n=1 Tax=Spirodela intermedia TaxID=51605 RepID=A0A7I8IV90_SPIIN|nr:unnamed protein product [Spirodela intermedia]CAA6661787.1 unnamed protein product [Spirodela intermedia]